MPGKVGFRVKSPNTSGMERFTNLIVNPLRIACANVTRDVTFARVIEGPLAESLPVVYLDLEYRRTCKKYGILSFLGAVLVLAMT